MQLYYIMLESHDNFIFSFRISIVVFHEILRKIESDLTKVHRSREPISAKEQLALTLR